MNNLLNKFSIESLDSNKKALLIVAGVAAVMMPSEMLASTNTLPAVVQVYSDIVTNIITKVVVGLVVLIMMVVSAWEMKENGNARPFKWAVFASIVMGGAVFFGPSILSYMSQTANTLTGAAAVITGS